MATASSASPSNVTFTASTSLMEDYRLGTEITAQTEIAQLVNAAGESELFYTGSTSQGGTVIYNVRPDSTTDTGWTVTAITPGTSPGQLAGGASNGSFTLFSVGPDTSNPDIYYIHRGATGTWGAWTAVDASSVFKSQAPPVQVRNIVAEVVNGALELAAVLSDARGQLSLWRVDWTGTDGGWQRLGSVSSPFLDICTTLAWGTGVLAVQMTGTSIAAMDLMFFSLDGKTTATVAAQQYFRSADSALQEPGASGVPYSGIFLYNDGMTGGKRSVSFIDCGVASPAVTTVDTTLTCTQIVAVPAGANPITLFALDANMQLNVISRQSDSTWEPAIELGEELSSITAGLDAGGAPLLFAVDAGNSNLLTMMRQPGSVGGEWAKQKIEAQVQTIEMVKVYGTTFTLMDGGGNTLPSTTLSLTSPETTVVSWQEQTYVIGPNVSRALTTNANGQVTLYAPTGSLSASKLIFSVPQLMATGDAICVHPDAHAQGRLRNITVPEVESLLPPQFQPDAAHVQQAVTAAMSYTPSSNCQVKNSSFFAAAERTKDYRRAIDPSSGRVQHWSFSVRDGRATFAELTAGEAAALREQLRAAVSPDGFFDFDWLGDIMDAVADTVESSFCFAVTTVGGAVEATIHCIINGVTYIFDGVIDTFEGAFEVVSSIFSSVFVFFEALFEFLAWLLTGARQDIWNTKEQFEGLINDSFPTLAALCAQGEAAAAGFFAGIKQEVAANFDAAIASVGSDTFNYDSLAAFARVPAGAGTLALSPGDVVEVFLDAAVKANWLIDKVTSVLGAPSFDSSLPQGVLDAFASFSAKLSSSIGQTILAEISAVGGYLASVATNPGNFMDSTISAALTAAKRLVLSILDVLDELTEAFFELAIAFLQAAKTGIFDQTVGGFFLGGLYNLLNPKFPFSTETLTVTRFVAILCAFPTTIIYRLITGDAPFSSSDSGELAAGTNQPLKMMGGLVTLVWSLGDAWLDFPRDPNAGPIDPLALYLGALVPVLSNILLSPGGTPFSLLPGDTDVEKATNGFWCVKWAPIGYTTIFTACTHFKFGPRRDKIPCGILAALGSAVLGTGIWKGVEESKAGTATGESWFSNIAGPLVTVAKPLKFLPPAGPIAVLAIDFVGDVGVGAIVTKNA